MLVLTVDQPVGRNTETLERFKRADTRKCATCHGQDGSGNTPVGKSLKVADLRSVEVQKKTDAELAQSIVEGKGNMPSFKSSVTEDEIRALVMYVRTLAPKASSGPKKNSGN